MFRIEKQKNKNKPTKQKNLNGEHRDVTSSKKSTDGQVGRHRGH